MRINYFRINLLTIIGISLSFIFNNASAQTFNIITYAGGGVGDGYTAVSATTNPTGVAIDASGNIYIADRYLNRVRKVTTAGIISTIAGTGVAAYGGDNGQATAAQLNAPEGVTIDASGNVYIADTYNYRVRKVATTGIITTIAGTGVLGYTGNGSAATAAELTYPAGIAIDNPGNIYITDQNDNVIRKFTVGGSISVYAGTGTAGYSGDNGPATGANLKGPTGIFEDNAYNLYIADQGNNRIRKVNNSGTITTVAGMGTAGFSGDGGNATAAILNQPSAVTADNSSNIYFCDQSNNRIRKVTSAGLISTIAGNGTNGYTGDGAAATAAELNFPSGIAIDGSANSYIADNGRIRKISSTGQITTYAGGGVGDGDPAISAELSIAEGNPNTTSFTSSSIAIDNSGDVFVSDVRNNRIREINSSGVILTIAGNGKNGYTGDGAAATAAELYYPAGVTRDPSGNLYIADYHNARVRKINTSGVITTIAGNGTGGYTGDGGAATAAELSGPTSVELDGAGNIYIADFNNNRIRKINTSGTISTVAGNGTGGYTGDGSAATAAELNNPSQIAFDANGNIYITDLNNNRIRKIATTGIISTFAGNGTAGFTGDGSAATAAELNRPNGVLVNGSTVFISDFNNNRIRKVNSNGIISTVAGNGSGAYSGDGGPSTSASLYAPTGMGVDASGNIYVADNNNNRVRKLTNTCTLAANISYTSDPQCYGNNNGAASVTAVNGTSPYTYLWTNGATTSSVSNFTTGTYSVTITDVNGCTSTTSVTLASPPLLTASISGSSAPTCYNGNNGSASVTASGGKPMPGYMYSWAPGGATTTSINNITAGTYTCTVTDSNSCNATATVTLNNPAPVIVTPTPSAVSICIGSSAPISVTGANTYSWSPASGLSLTTGASVNASPTVTTTYTVTGTNANGCFDTVSVVVTVHALPTTTASPTSPTICSGNSTAINATGATSYSWSPGASLNITTGASVNATPTVTTTYTITGTNAGGCSSTATTIVTVNATPTVTASATPQAVCLGSSSSLTVSGANAYTWSPIASLSTSTGSSVTATPTVTTTYTVTGTNSSGCTNTSTIVIKVNPLPTVTVSSTNVSCNGGNNGSAMATASGGVPPFTYMWNTTPVQNSITAGNLPAGTYNATIIDANGCTATSAGATVTQPTALSGTTNTTNSTCGASNGGTSVVASGGTLPYKYVWSNGSTTTSASNLSAGTYQVSIIDGNNCISDVSAVVTNSGGPTVTPTVTNVSCNGQSSGSISLAVTGNAPFTYAWSKGTKHSCTAVTPNTTSTLSGLAAGTYQVIVTDNNGCSTILAITVSQSAALTLNANSTSAGCSLSNGDASVTVSGGTSPYTFCWDHTCVSTSSSMNNVSAGAYSVLVTDNNGCMDSTTVSVNNTGGPTINITNTTNVSCGNSTQGSITVAVSGGTPSYTYLWNNGITTQNLVNLSQGSYNLTVTDHTGCKGVATATIQNAVPIGVPICMVTVDTNQKNLVIWNRTNERMIQSYNVYREVSGGASYSLVGNVCASGYTEFFDSVVNTQLLSYTYKVSELDSCGGESPLSPALNSIHLTTSVSGGTINLTWDPYQGAFGSYYYIYRDTVKERYTKYDSVPNTTLTWTDTKPMSTSDTVHYCVGAEGVQVCNPYTTARVWAINYNASKSNTGSIFFNPTTVEAVNIENNSFEVYPDPTSGICNLSISLSNGTQNVGVKLLNAIGQVIWNDNYVNVSGRLKKQIDLSGFSKGIYFVQITTGNGVMYRKVAVQ